MVGLHKLCKSATRNLQDSFNDLPQTRDYLCAMGIKQEAGRRIKAAREAKGLILKDVEQLVPGITFNRLSNWEQGRNMIGVAEAKKLAPALGVTAAYLLTLEDEPAEQREKALLDHYRNSDSRGRDHIFRVAEQESHYTVEGPDESAKAA